MEITYEQFARGIAAMPSPISRAEGAAGNPATVTPNTSNQQDGGER